MSTVYPFPQITKHQLRFPVTYLRGYVNLLALIPFPLCSFQFPHDTGGGLVRSNFNYGYSPLYHGGLAAPQFALHCKTSQILRFINAPINRTTNRVTMFAATDVYVYNEER